MRTDGGYIVAGNSASFDGDVTGQHGGSTYGDDYWAVKLDSVGVLQWQKCLGGSDEDWAQSIIQTNDGGYVIAGCTMSNDGDVSGNHGTWDYWIVKLDPSGILNWQKCFGGSNLETAYCIRQTSDNGYIIAGGSGSNDGDVSDNHGNSDFWIVKLYNSGMLQWQQCLGGSDGEGAYTIRQTSDGGYIVAGVTFSNDGDVSGDHQYYDPDNDSLETTEDWWIVKLSPTVGIEETNTTTTFTLFPNPATNNLQLNLPQKAEITILNIQGQEIITLAAAAGTTNINISALASGMYFIKVTTDKEIIIKKFVKE